MQASAEKKRNILQEILQNEKEKRKGVLRIIHGNDKNSREILATFLPLSAEVSIE